MFDYAIAQHRKHAPSKRLLASWAISCMCHVVLVLVLIEYPQLLHSGMYHYFRQVTDFRSSAAPKKEWRSVAFVGTKLEMPPAEELKKVLYDWNKAKAKAAERPPIRVNLPRGISDEGPLPVPKQPDAAGATNNPPVPLAGTAGTATSPAASGGAGDARNATTAGQPPPQGTEPKQIPKGLPDALPTGAASKTPARPPAASETGGQQTGVRMEGNIFFDDRGFNLKDYAELVTQRVKEHWFIPSNLRNYEGSATIIFYILRDGQAIGAKIEVFSGNQSLDLSALTAVLDSGPFPPLPKGFPTDRVGARLIFAYRERQ